MIPFRVEFAFFEKSETLDLRPSERATIFKFGHYIWLMLQASGLQAYVPRFSSRWFAIQRILMGIKLLIYIHIGGIIELIKYWNGVADMMGKALWI